MDKENKKGEHHKRIDSIVECIELFTKVLIKWECVKN